MITEDSAKLIASYKSYLQLVMHNPRTANYYSLSAERLLDDCGKEAGSIEPDDVIHWLGQKCGDKRQSFRHAFYALKNFFRYCITMELVERVPMKRRWLPKLTKTSRKSLTPDEEARIMVTSESSPATAKERAAINLLLDTGIRKCELVGLRIKDLDFVARKCRVTGKFNKERIVPLSPKCVILLREVLKTRPNDKNALVFVTVTGRPVTHELWYITNGIAERAGLVRKLGPQACRHTYATRELSSDDDLEAVKAALGHEEADTTRIYAQPFPDDVIRKIQYYLR